MIARYFVRRDFVAVLLLVITLVGWIAFYTLPIAQYSPITPPEITISISYPEASPSVVAETVAAPIERQVNGIGGMRYISPQILPLTARTR